MKINDRSSNHGSNEEVICKARFHFISPSVKDSLVVVMILEPDKLVHEAMFLTMLGSSSRV
jgi:hypothetical protein